MIDKNTALELGLDNFNSLNELANDVVELILAGPDAKETSCKELGLDERAYYGDGPWIVDNNGRSLVFRKPTGALDYYGHFEYVDKGAIREFGDYTIYSEEDERVAEHIARALGEEINPEDDDE
jgi:hypothetical protein